MTEGEAIESLDPEFYRSTLRSGILGSAYSKHREAFGLDREAQRYAVEHYVEYVDYMPLSAMRIQLVPGQASEAVKGIEKAYVYYPTDRAIFRDQDDFWRLIFVRTTSESGDQADFMVTPEKILLIDTDDMHVDINALELSDFDRSDPAGIFYSHDRDLTNTLNENDQLDVLQDLHRILRDYRLKAQTSPREEQAS